MHSPELRCERPAVFSAEAGQKAVLHLAEHSTCIHRASGILVQVPGILVQVFVSWNAGQLISKENGVELFHLRILIAFFMKQFLLAGEFISQQ